MEEQKKSEKDGQNENKTSDQEKVQNTKLSQPVVFVPVYRSLEIQVCILSESNWLNLEIHSNNGVFWGYFSVPAGGSAKAACAGRGTGHHGGRKRKFLCCHLRRNGKWKDHSSSSVSVWSWLCQVGYPPFMLISCHQIFTEKNCVIVETPCLICCDYHLYHYIFPAVAVE